MSRGPLDKGFDDAPCLRDSSGPPVTMKEVVEVALHATVRLTWVRGAPAEIDLGVERDTIGAVAFRHPSVAAPSPRAERR